MPDEKHGALNADENIKVEDRELFDSIVNPHVDAIKRRIAKNALQFMRADSWVRLDTNDIMQSCLIATGDIDKVEASVFWHAPKTTIREKISSSISSLTIVSAILAVIFGVLGLFPQIIGVGAQAQQATGFLDIAKIFAGAIVASAGVSMVTRRNR